MGIKSRAENKKLNKRGVQKEQKCSSDQHPFFSFRYMTANGGYNINYLNSKDDNERSKTLAGIYASLERISSEPWTTWISRNKAQGLETIDYGRLNFEACGTTVLTRDTKVYIFRFATNGGNGKGRIIGFKDSPCSAFHIIGYDFNFSAYSHG